MKYISSILRILLFVLIITITASNIINGQVITTIAGNGQPGYSGDGGPGLSASLNVPTGIDIDKDGNLLIVDYNNHVIRKLNLKTGIITTAAGNGKQDDTGDGQIAINASLYYPISITVDKSGNIYIAEEGGGSIRKISRSSGIITSVAGIGNTQIYYGGDGDLATKAELHFPTGVAVDASGNIYIADWQNNVIRKVDISSGIISTYAGYFPGKQGYYGDGFPATKALLNRCSRLCIDPAGNLIISDQDNSVIRKVDAISGIISTIAGSHKVGYSGDGGLAVNAELALPSCIKIDPNGNLIVADSHNSVIRSVDAVSGIITTIAGNGKQGYSGDGGLPLNASFNDPKDMVFDADSNLYVADAANNVIRKISFCPQILLKKDTTVCQSAPIVLDAGNSYTQFKWNTGSNAQFITVKDPGKYWVTATNPGSKCIITDTIRVSNFAVHFNWPHDPVICKGSSITLNIPTGVSSVKWQDGSSASSYVISNPGKYWATVTSNNCSYTDTLRIEKTIPPPSQFLATDTNYCRGGFIALQPNQTFRKYLWSTGDNAISININKQGFYWLQVQDIYNCTWKNTSVVKEIKCKEDIHFPNAFTPNNDGKNDLFRPVVEGAINSFNMKIFTRWGNKIFETNNYMQGWDGKLQDVLQQSTVYLWMAEYQLAGSTKTTARGTFVLLK